MTSLLSILPSPLSCLEVHDELKESNCSGSLYADFFLLLLKKLSLFSTISLCLSQKHAAWSRSSRCGKGSCFVAECTFKFRRIVLFLQPYLQLWITEPLVPKLFISISAYYYVSILKYNQIS